MPDKYVKTLVLKTEVDEKQYKEFKTKFKKDSFTFKLLDEKDAKELAENYAKVQAKMEKIRKLKEAIAEVDLYGGKDKGKIIKALQKELKEAQKTSVGDKAQKGLQKGAEFLEKKVKNALVDGAEAIGKFIKNAFKSAIEELNEMAGSNFSSTLFSNDKLLSTSLQYGLNGGQSYALTKALDFFGKSSIEDTYTMSGPAKEKFNEKINKYLDKYNQLNDAGFFSEWDNFRYEFKTFKEDMTYEIMEWIMDNKDTIKAGFKALVEGMKVIINVLSWIGSLLGTSRTQSEIDAKTSDIISHYSTSSNTNQNVNINNTFNGVQTSNRQQFVNAGELTYKQFLKALDGF